jgi:hypothetical protein
MTEGTPTTLTNISEQYGDVGSKKACEAQW